jgi:NADH dehydrogenase [ubiquinone] 1 alpha subcomplex assembly factor 5
MELRSARRDRAARTGRELFLYERAFADCLERVALMERRFERALLIGCPDPSWPQRLGPVAAAIDVRDPGAIFASDAGGAMIVEDRWEPPSSTYDLILAIGTFDSVDDLPLALRLLHYAMRANGLLLGAISGGDTLPQLRAAMRAADSRSGAAAPHVHPRIEAAALAPLLADAGFIAPVVDIDRIPVSYRSFDRLIADLRAMGATNILTDRPYFVGKAARQAASDAFVSAGDGERTVETFEILHFAAWTAKEAEAALT